jgi:BirA family biotin operon repressor/biotin-[acetyl-CoA-carboxylase] ligase
VASTQDEARRRFAGVPCVVTAQAQEAGRGRGGAHWLNAPRALAASVGFVPEWPGDRIPLLTLVAGLAARRVLDPSLRLKWPNDLVDPAGDKVAGLLAERTGDLVVIGLGANLYWPDPPPGIAALAAVDPGAGAGPELGRAWAEGVIAAVAAGPDDWGIGEYREHSATIGSVVDWEGGGPGRAVDIDESGGLVVDIDGVRRVLRSGRVRLVRPTTLTD